MGQVYLAQDTKLRRKVALKLLSAELASRPNTLRRFVQEAEAAAALSHPNVAHIYEVNRQGGMNFIAMEYVEGDTLRRRVTHGRISLREALDISSQVAEAISAAHLEGIVHRDIKPENIMLRPDGYVKVLDFGLAKLIEQRALSSDTSAPTIAKVDTEPGLLLGTLNYMSPEQARGKEVDARTDIFSFGVLLYEMVTGRAPFEGETTSDIIAAILKAEPDPISSYAPDAPPELQRIISKALRKDREERYQTMKDMLVDLKTLRQEFEFAAKLESSAPPDPSSRSVATSVGTAAATASAPAVTTGRAAAPVTSITEYVFSGIKRHKAGFISALALLIAAASGAYFYLAPSGAAAIDSLAVLPFVNQNRDPESEYLSDGLTESIINNLSQVPNLRVMARSTVFRYKARDVDPLVIGRELGVRALLTGRVAQRGDSLSVQAELVDAATGAQLWGERYDRKVADALTVQQDISLVIANRLRLRLTGSDQQRLVKIYTENPEAYQLYLQGRFHWNKRSPEGLRKAVEYFKQAIALDPNYALAYAGLADAYSISPTYDLTIKPKGTMPQAREAALKALALDAELAEAHASLGLVLDIYDWQSAKAIKHFRRAIELNPKSATAHRWLGERLLRDGQFEECLTELQRSLELEPFSLATNRSLGNRLNCARRYDEAITQLKKTLELDPNFKSANYMLYQAYADKGMYSEAVATYLRGIVLDGELARAARTEEAFSKNGWRGFLQHEAAYLEKQPRASTHVAHLYARLGDKDKAFGWLEKAYDERSESMTWLKVDPVYDPLRTDPRYQDLLRRVGLAQ